MRGIPVFGPYAPIPMWSGRSASAGSRRIHGLSPSTSNEITTAHRAPFFHLIGRSMTVSSRRRCEALGLVPRHLHQHLRVRAHALADVLQRDPLVVAVDPLKLRVLEDEGAEAVAVESAPAEHPVVSEGDEDH